MTHPAESFDKMLAEHDALHALFDRVRAVLADKVEPRESLSAMLAEMTDQLAKHFRYEEEDELFEQIAAKAPRLTDRAMALKHQHPLLMREIHALVTNLDEGELDANRWQELDTAFEGFTIRFAQHEREENALLQEAYERDVGDKD